MPKVKVHNLSGKAVGEIELSDSVFDATVNEAVLYDVLKAQLASKRKGAASAQTRAEVSATGSNVTVTGLTLLGGDVQPAPDGDLDVDMQDATLIAGAYGTVSGGPGWNPNADINADDAIDILDLTIMGGNYDLTSATAYGTWTP